MIAGLLVTELGKLAFITEQLRSRSAIDAAKINYLIPPIVVPGC